VDISDVRYDLQHIHPQNQQLTRDRCPVLSYAYKICEGLQRENEQQKKVKKKKRQKNNLCAETAKMRSEKKGTADNKKPEQQMTFP